MARPKLKANFFVRTNGEILSKAAPLTRDQRLRIFNRDKATCQSCGAACGFGGNRVSPFDEEKCSQVDHILARARGGQNHDSNLRLLCFSCNARKGANNG